jgi:hypothetical protein
MKKVFILTNHYRGRKLLGVASTRAEANAMFERVCEERELNPFEVAIDRVRLDEEDSVPIPCR